MKINIFTEINLQNFSENGGFAPSSDTGFGHYEVSVTSIKTLHESIKRYMGDPMKYHNPVNTLLVCTFEVVIYTLVIFDFLIQNQHSDQLTITHMIYRLMYRYKKMQTP